MGASAPLLPPAPQGRLAASIGGEPDQKKQCCNVLVESVVLAGAVADAYRIDEIVPAMTCTELCQAKKEVQIRGDREQGSPMVRSQSVLMALACFSSSLEKDDRSPARFGGSPFDSHHHRLLPPFHAGCGFLCKH